MLKRLFITACALASSLVFAGNSAPYVGASVGIVSNTASNSGVSFRGAPVSVFAGYGASFDNNLYIAGEANLTPATSSIEDNGLKTSYGYSASVLPGVMVTDHTLLFGRVGWNRAHFSTQDETKSGLLLGLGSQVNISQNLDVRGEYNFVAHRDTANVSQPRSDAFHLGLVYKIN